MPKLTLRTPSEDDVLRAAELAWDEVEGLVVEKIQARTEKGVALDGSKFAPYSERYAEQRQKEGLGTKPVTLRRSRKMLHERLGEVGRDTANGVVSYGVKGDRAIVAAVNNARRPFLGLTARESVDVGKRWLKTFYRALSGRKR